MATRSGLWGDEALCIFVARLPHVADTLSFLINHESHPPFNYLLLRGWSALFGISELALLTPSIIFGVATVVLVFYVGRRTYGVAEGCIASFFTAVSPEVVEFSSQVRPYALLQLLALASCFLLWQIRRNSTPSLWVGYTVCATLMVYTHNWSWIVIIAQALCYLASITIASLQNEGRLGNSWLRSAAAGIVALLAVIIFYLPWLPALLRQGGTAGYGALLPNQIAAQMVLVILASADITTPWRLATSQIKMGIVWAVTITVLVLGFKLRRKEADHSAVDVTDDAENSQRKQRLATIDSCLFFGGVFVLGVLIAAVLSVKSNLLQHKCTSMLVPGTYVLWAWLVASCVRASTRINLSKVSRTLLRTGSICMVVVMSISIIYQDWVLWNNPKSWAREYAAFVATNATPEDTILIAPPWFSSSFNWYYSKPTFQITYPYFKAGHEMAWDNLFNLYNDPVAYTKVKDELTRRSKRGTVWMITSGQTASAAEISPAITMLPSTKNHDWSVTGVERSVQLFHHLENLYGRPPQLIKPNDPSKAAGVENLVLYRFSR